MRTGPISSKIGLVFLCLLLLGCGPESRYKTLKIFFDGVPNPAAQKEQENIQQVEKNTTVPSKKKAAPASQIKSRHQDYETRNCSRCHDQTSATYLNADRKRICFLCHKEDDFTGEFIHGPVAVGDCLSCHHPHESKFKKLLQAEGPGLCTKCHKTENLAESTTHRQNAGMDCSICHLPHKSDSRFFLKAPAP